MTGRYPFFASYTHRLPSAPAVIMRDPSGVNWTATTSPLCCRCCASVDVVSTSNTLLTPALKPTASALPALFLPGKPTPLPPGRYATAHATSPASPANSYSCSPLAQSHTRAVPSAEHVAISSRSGSGSNATPVTAPACERSSVRYACEGISRTPRLPVLVDAATCRPSAETEHEVTADSCSASRKKSEKSTGHTRRNPSSDAVTAKPSETRRSLILSSCSWNTRSSCLLP